MSQAADPAGDASDFSIDVARLVGIWADATRVRRARDEFTLDFVRRIPYPVNRVLVARTVLPPVFAVELRDQLDEAWRAYSEWSSPEEPR